MVDVPLKVILSGSEADGHTLPAYDGFMAMAGIALSSSLITNYVTTGKIRHRGNFAGRSQVHAAVPENGSLLFPLTIDLFLNSPILAAFGPIGAGVASAFLYDLLKHVISRNIGVEHEPDTAQLKDLEEKKGGDLEALAAATEPSLRQAHTIIGAGATQIVINGGTNHISTFNGETKEYINLSLEDEQIIEKDVSVAAFNANSGVGRVFDEDYGRTIPIYLTEETFATAKPVLGWGLNEYSKGSGKKISLRYRRTLAWDGTPKRYVVLDAEIPGA